jgi:DNA-binding protein Fis
MAMVDGDLVDAPDLPSGMRSMYANGATGLDRTLAQVELEYVRRVLESVAGNKTRAAKILGIDRKTLREKLKLIPK